MAKTFGVTADWLLDESAEPAVEPAPEPVDAPDPDSVQRPLHPYADETESTRDDNWVESIPGVVGWLVRKFGWLVGVRMAIAGALFTAMGFVAKAMFGSMISMSNQTFDSLGGSMFGGGSVTFYDNAGNVVDPSQWGLDVSQFGVTTGNAFGYTASNPFDIMCTFIIVLGVAMLIGGIVLAVWLKGKQQEHA
ncbi:MAG: hypothetical protein IJ438_01730 [Clostridia bacterium]|nr:hypothetical protein [Clostridia bacterium]